jgi:hypothetical protein
VDIKSIVPPDPIELTTPSGQRVTLKWLSLSDIVALERLLKSSRPPRDVMLVALHRQLLEPKVTPTAFAAWADEDLATVARGWITHRLGFDLEMPEGEVAQAFRDAAESYLNDTTREASAAMKRAFEAMRLQNEHLQRMLGPTSLMNDVLRGWRQTESAWRELFRVNDVLKRQQELMATLGTARVLDEITRTARLTLSQPLISNLPDLGRALQAAAVDRALIANFQRLSAPQIRWATELHLGLESITKSAESVWRDWATAGEELGTLPDSLRIAPATEIYTASAAAARLVTGQVSPTPEGLNDRALALEGALPGLLADVHAQLPKLLAGAAALLDSTAPDSGRHFAISLRELLTHTLHRLAPDTAVAGWPDRRDQDFDKGRPTRAGRVRFILRIVSNTAYAPFVQDDIRRTVELIEALNGATHDLESASDPLTRRLVLRRVHFAVGLLLDAHRAAQH